jgi:hypothetical protein
VQALWDEEHAKWWFSVVDIVAVLTDQDDYTKTRNYWKYLKAKLKKEGSQVVSATTQLKLTKPDYMNVLVKSPVNSSSLKKLLKNGLTSEIDSRELYLKGIDYSYYYEEN